MSDRKPVIGGKLYEVQILSELRAAVRAMKLLPWRFRYILILIRHLPPVPRRRFAMPVVLVTVWVVLRWFDWPNATAFVWSVVLAQIAHYWSVFHGIIDDQRRVFGRVRWTIAAAMAILIAIFAFQIWWSEPWMSQRIISVYCTVMAIVMVLGVLGDAVVLDRFAATTVHTNSTLRSRRHLLKLYALMAILVIVLNEGLLALDTPLGVRVAAFALLPVLLHYALTLILQLTLPATAEEEI